MAGQDDTEASAKVQEVAANMQQAAATRKRISGSKAESVARRYFEAIDQRDVEAAVALWTPGGRDYLRGRIDAVAPDGVREFLTETIEALPDLSMEVISTITEGDRCGVQWRLRGTFSGAGVQGIAPTDTALELEGFDLMTVRDGLIYSNDAFTDSLTFARQVGMMPAQGSAAERRMTSAFNVKTHLTGRLASGEANLIAEGVWVVQGQPARCNVYLIEDEGGVTMFDAGARTMTRAVARAAAKLGGVRRIVLGHGHTDHRGVAPSLGGVPVLCHPDEVQDAEGSGGFRYWPEGLRGLPTGMRQMQLLLHRFAWDGGPVHISGTLTEGDEVAGFRVIELPGHAPGLIALWREQDRLALTTDCFYTLDMWGRDSDPHVPFAVYNYDTDRARASIRKLAALEPAAAWPGHARPVTGDVRSALLRAADTT
jgi:glyoxylase-like metal-dependent hydrolase (beta-lactamase superfamily II)/ketosteroid isomerase-like protein